MHTTDGMPAALPAVTLRPLTRADLPMLARWLAEPLVSRWWNHETTPQAVERDFGPGIDGADVTEMFLAEHGEAPYGLVQRYPIAAYPDYVTVLTPVLTIPPGALSVDYLVGEPGARGRGLGAAMIDEAVRSGWKRHPEAGDVIVPVSAANRDSWRTLERAGFHRAAVGELAPDNPIDSRDHAVYLRRRSGR